LGGRPTPWFIGGFERKVRIVVNFLLFPVKPLGNTVIHRFDRKVRFRRSCVGVGGGGVRVNVTFSFSRSGILAHY